MTIMEQYENLINDALMGEEDDETEVFLDSSDLVRMQKRNSDTDEKYLDMPQTDIEETVHFQRFNKPREHVYTEEEMTEIRKSCKMSLVNDFGPKDIYHMSDEEKAKMDSLNELRLKLNSIKTMYRRVDQYVEAMRIVVQAWELLEKKDNYIHSEDEFFEMVAHGQIVNNSIPMPKLAHRNQYNMDLIIRYISNSELDPADLMPKKEDSWYDQFTEPDESEEEEMERLLSPEEVQYILDDNPDPIVVKPIKRKYVVGYNNRGNSKKLKKADKAIQETTFKILNQIQMNPKNRNGMSRSYMLTRSMFEQDKEEGSPLDDIRFEGSWTSKSDLFIYDLIMQEEYLKQQVPNNKYQTYADQELQEFFVTMEKYGWNAIKLRRIMNMTTEQSQAENVRKTQKANKKMEQRILQRMIKLNNSEKFKKMVDKAEQKLANAEPD